jgi:hypothetical protein
MKKLIILFCLLKMVDLLQGQNTNIPPNFLQELLNQPSMGCCQTAVSGNYNPVFEDNFGSQNDFNNNWFTSEKYNLTGTCARFYNKNGYEPSYWSPNNATLGTALDENGQQINALILKVDKVSPPITCSENGKTITANYTSGMVWSKAEYRYGKF